jgi:hypothetical protein
MIAFQPGADLQLLSSSHLAASRWTCCSQSPPEAKLATLAVCHGPSCTQNGGGQSLLDAASLLATSCERGPFTVRIDKAECLGHCGIGVNVGFVSGAPGAVPTVKTGLTSVSDLAAILRGACGALDLDERVLSALESKEVGNEAFGMEDMTTAIARYTYALTRLDNVDMFPTGDCEAARKLLAKTCAGILANRSGAYASEDEWEHALNDANTSVCLCSTLVAARRRQGNALEALGRRVEAAEAFDAAAALETVTQRRRILVERAKILRRPTWGLF